MSAFDIPLPEYSQVFPVPRFVLALPDMTAITRQLDLQMEALRPILDDLAQFMKRIAELVAEIARYFSEMVGRMGIDFPWTVAATTAPYGSGLTNSGRDLTPRIAPKRVAPVRTVAITVNNYHIRHAEPSTTTWLTWNNVVGLVSVIGVIFAIFWSIFTASWAH